MVMPVNATSDVAPVPDRASVALIVRVEDGPLQFAVLRPVVRERQVAFYEVLNCTVRVVNCLSPTRSPNDVHRLNGTEIPSCTHFRELHGDVLVFVNKPLESVNHFFLEELVRESLRQDCGVVTGISCDFSGNIVHSGWTYNSSGECVDKFAGRTVYDCLRGNDFAHVCDVDVIAGDFFAVRREHLEALGGLALISSTRIHRLIKELTQYAMRKGLRVLATPRAVATVENRPRSITATKNIGDGNPNTFALERSLPLKQADPGSPPSQTNRRYPVWRYAIPIPPDCLMGQVGAPTVENFLVVADAWGQVINRYTPEAANVLDIGCGCGRLARVLVNQPHIRKYMGFDVMREHIQWCRQFIEAAWPQVAEFVWYDVHSTHYNPSGVLRSGDLRFPCADGTIHVALAASVFTHLLEADARHYLAEVARVLASNGFALLSIHDTPAPDAAFSGTEDRIDIDPEYFVRMAAQAGLKSIDCIEDFCGQRLFIFRKRQ